jgi:D-alanine transaminase
MSTITREYSRSPAGRIAYVEGRYLPHGQACVHIEDRGLQFADSVYEVCAIQAGRLLDERGHLDRLERSLLEIKIPMPMERASLRAVMRETVRRNRIVHGLLYMQVTRGAYRRDHAIPQSAHRPTLILTARQLDFAVLERRRSQGVRVVSMPDQRWARCDIKSTALLPNVLAKSQAREQGAYEAWFVDHQGFVTEGSSTNAWIVTRDGILLTRPLSPDILPGVTRAGVLRAAREAGIRVEERAFTLEEAYAAREAFFTAATAWVMPVVEIDGRPVANAHPGEITEELASRYRAFAEAPVD